MTENENKEAWPRFRRFFAGLYFAIAVGIVVIFWREIFYLNPATDSYNWYRYLWCVSASFIGFAVLAIQLRDRETRDPRLPYCLYYPTLLLVIAGIVFSATHLFKPSRGYVFYYLAASVCFILAFTVDRFWSYVDLLARKVQAKS